MELGGFGGMWPDVGVQEAVLADAGRGSPNPGCLGLQELSRMSIVQLLILFDQALQLSPFVAADFAAVPVLSLHGTPKT